MKKTKEYEMEKVFGIEKEIVEVIHHWAKDVAKVDIEHLRSCLIAGGEFCDMCLLLSTFYNNNLEECHKLIKEGRGDPVINERRLALLEIGERTNNLSGYLALLQMDAMMSIIHMLEAQSDVECLLICKHAYTVFYDAKIKGLFRVVSKEMRELPEDVLSKDRLDELWRGIKSSIRLLLSEAEAEKVRNNIDAHKSSFIEQMDAYKQCDFGRSAMSMFALMKIAWIIQETLSEVQENLKVLEDHFVDLVKDRIKKWEDLRVELETKGFPIVELSQQHKQ